ncbi:MAG: DUF3106 domain-containing protein [Bryobacterales bacterium]|nr:DUF3106 domain-containing protein [Bryobacterales bacterium]
MAAQRGERQRIRQLRIIDRLAAMNPAERERLLSTLPPQRRRIVEENLKRFEAMPPEQRAALMRRLESFDEMAPGQQAQFRELLRKVAQMPEERRRLVREEFRRIQRMTDAERLDYVSSNTFRKSLSDTERDLVLDLVETAPEP